MKGRDILDIDNFDPLNVDLSIIKQTTAEIPQDGFIDSADAGRLATKFLVAAERCAELVAQAQRWYGYKEAEKKGERAAAIARKIAGDKTNDIKAIPATTAKEAYGDDKLYQKADKELATAIAWLEYIVRVYDTLNKYHHLCKSMMMGEKRNTSLGGWGEQGIHDNDIDNDFEQKSTNGRKVTGPVSW